MKKYLSLLLISLFSFSLFAQTNVPGNKLGKTLEKNKDASAVFVSEIDLGGMTISESGTVIIPLFAKNKIKVVSAMDMTSIKERIAYAKKNVFEVTFQTQDVPSHTYGITAIKGIESAEEYNSRLEEEARKRAEEEKARMEAERLANLTKFPVQIINQEVSNLNASETVWLPGQVQDKIKSNLQDYLGMKTVVDSKSEAMIKKLQAESEGAGRDESTAIEIGKITTAKFAVFTKLRKNTGGYVISADFTDLTTGEQMANVTSKEYSKAEYLYGSTGAIDELTLSLADKLGINISDLNRKLLSSGSANFSVDDQLELARQNEAQFKKMMSQYDAELSKLMQSNEKNAVQNKKRLEAEKALLAEKQKAEQKRQEELKAQKARADEDAKLEAERSIALKTQRDQMAKDAAVKAAEVRKLKMEKQGVLSQINILESKKKALVEIRQSVESRSQELYDQLVKDRKSEEERIRNKSYSTVELGSDGKPTEQALERREKQVIKSYEDLTNKFFSDCESVKQSTMAQQNALLSEIRADQKALTPVRTVSSMGEELKVSFGKYEGSKDGWNAYISMYSDGQLVYADTFIVKYEALSGKKAPDMTTELNDAVIEEYTNNVDMYNSLLVRGDPIIYFEIDYNVTAEADDRPSQYKFNFSKIRVINTVSGKVTQNSVLNAVKGRAMQPEQDLREIVGIVAEEKEYFTEVKDVIARGYNLDRSLKVGKNSLTINSEFVKINKDGNVLAVLQTEVHQTLYEWVMGSNPSKFQGDNNPVECVSWYDAIYFCNALSIILGYTPVYSVNGTTDVTKWDYTPHKDNSISGTIIQNINANGYRLPTVEEWQYAAKGGQNYTYSGSNDIDEVAWYDGNSANTTHPVAQKKANGYGLYDMTGNVWEWCWDVYPYDCSGHRYNCGGSHYSGEYDYADLCKVDGRHGSFADSRRSYFGFRLVRSLSKPLFCEESLKPKMVKIPGKNYEMMATEVTQGLYESVMGENPSYFQVKNIDEIEREYSSCDVRVVLKNGSMNNPVERINWYDAIYFCNKLSEEFEYTPVYSVDGTTDVTKWKYAPHNYESISGTITQNINADGFRLPTLEEWQYAAKGGQNFTYTGSNNIDEVAWYGNNSAPTTYPVAKKKPNGYGLYDMNGNVWEWVWDFYNGDYRYICGGCWLNNARWCKVDTWDYKSPYHRYHDLGFRLVRTIK